MGVEPVNRAPSFLLPSFSIKDEEGFDHRLACLTRLFADHRGKSPDRGDAIAIIDGDNAAICPKGTIEVISKKGEDA